ncbi:hypothetical protein K501DRAFT_261663 [Backusella circina FSU 941]|nr:hypothetical protein K501DRAFT_261663 [Backusella circina FSU 941]
MSRGGFGRGGGRGGGGGAQSGAMQLVSFDLLKDLGSGSLFNVNTALFPDMDVPIPRKPTSYESEQWLLKKDQLEGIKTTPFHMVPPPPALDIERYSDKYRISDAVKSTLKDMESSLDFFPEELQTIIDPRKRKKQKSRAVQDEYGQIEALLDAETKKDDDGDDDDENAEKKEGSDAEGEFGEEYEDEEDLVDDNDYAQNYFDNGEGDDIDDDDGDGDYY